MDSNQMNSRFCSVCGAPLTDTPFCGQCGAKVVVTAVHTPEPQEEVTPVETVAPAAKTVAPVVAAPAVATLQDEKPATWKFPLISAILTGILVIAYLISLIPQFGRLNWEEIPSLAVSFVLSCMELCCYVAVLVGMMTCKKQRNLAVALGFMVLALCGMIGGPVFFVNYMSYYDFGIGHSLYLSIHSWICIAFDLMVAVSYLIAKPKAAKLKMGACIAALGVKFLIMVIDLIVIRTSFSGFVATFFNFLVYDVALYLSVLLYTPFKKQ